VGVAALSRSPDDDGLNGEVAATLFIELGEKLKCGEPVGFQRGRSCWRARRRVPAPIWLVGRVIGAV
jgi:hypothetical protein